LTDAVEKGICGNLEETLIQDWKLVRNLDSNIQLAGFVCFKFQFHISFAEAFLTVSANKRLMRCNKIVSAPPSVSSRI
jgi:hypothetical protein